MEPMLDPMPVPKALEAAVGEVEAGVSARGPPGVRVTTAPLESVLAQDDSRKDEVENRRPIAASPTRRDLDFIA